MAGALPAGEPVPETGMLPPAALDALAGRALSVYVHVPFCARRCGYCDFNTYVPAELGADASRERFLAAALAEIDLAAGVLGGRATGVGTVFFGGGTPTMLTPAQLGSLLRRVDERFGLLPGAEVTTEANPETVDAGVLGELRAAGFTRISLGMQSAVPHVLRVLDRAHTPRRAVAAAGWAREAGFEHVSLDLIYGTPGESLADWETSLAAIPDVVDHVSAYALIVEDGTPLARRVRTGQMPAPDDDDLADKYVVAEERLAARGLINYEVSNWARPGGECRHNLAYWRGESWWGVGPGAHSHVAGVRWWNVKHPGSYAERLASRRSPGAGRELLTATERHEERVLLELRLAEGIEWAALTAGERERAAAPIAAGLAERAKGMLRLTAAGRLLADAVIRDLLC